MARKKPKILECDGLVIGDADGARTEVTAGELKMYGEDGTLRVKVQAEDDGDYRTAHIGLFTSLVGNELDPTVSIGVCGSYSWIDLYTVDDDDLRATLEIKSTPAGPRLAMFDERLSVLFAAPTCHEYNLQDELAIRIAETAEVFVAEHGLNGQTDEIVSAALEYAQGEIDRLRAAKETEGVS